MEHLYKRTIVFLFACVYSIFAMHAEVIDIVQLLPQGKSNMGRPITTVSGEHVSLIFSRGEGKTTPSNYGYVRLYKGNFMSVNAEKKVRKITCHFLKTGKEVIPETGEMTVSNGTLDNDNVWQGSSDQLVYTFYPPRGNTFALVKVELEYDDGNDPPTIKPGEDKPNTKKTLPDIASFKQTELGKPATLSLNKAIVLGCNDAELFIQDHTGLIRLSLSETTSWQKGDVVTGEVRGVYEDKEGLPTIKEIEKIKIKKISSKKASPQNVSADLLSQHAYKWVHTTFTNNNQLRLANSRTGVDCKAYDGAEIECDAIVIPQGSTLLLYPIASQDVTIKYFDDKPNTYGEAQNVNVHIEHALKQGVFNTLTLPISLTAADVKAIFGQAAVVAKFARAEAQTIVFEQTTGGMAAGEAYLVKPQADMQSIFIAQTQVRSPKVDTNSQFVGTLNVTTPPAGSYYINRQSKLQSFFGNQQIKAFKAYFYNIDNAEGKSIVINNVTNGIQQTAIDNDADSQSPTIYNLNGQKMVGKIGALPRGIYIIDGKKAMVR